MLLPPCPGLNAPPSEPEGHRALGGCHLPAAPAVWWVRGARSSGWGRLSPLEDAAGALLRPRGLGAQDGPDRLIEDGFEASLGEGRALQVFHRVCVRQREGRGLGQGTVLSKTPSRATQPHRAVGAPGLCREFSALCLSFLVSETGILTSAGGLRPTRAGLHLS